MVIECFHPVRSTSQAFPRVLWEDIASRFVHVVACVFPLERRRHEEAQVFCQSEAGLVREELLDHVAFVHVYAFQTALLPTALLQTTPLQTALLQTTPFAFGLICISRPVWQCLRRKGNERLCTKVVSIVVVHLVLFDSDQRVFPDCIPGPVARPAARRNSCRSWSSTHADEGTMSGNEPTPRASVRGGGDGEDESCAHRLQKRCEEGFRGCDEQ
jgi:hypothetical protein